MASISGCAFYTDVGGRKNNEDSVLCESLGGLGLFIVADGLGGHNDGEVASQTATQALRNFMATNPQSDVISAVAYANNAVLQKQEELNSKMKTTLAFAVTGEKETVVAHVGDSRIYAFLGGKIVFMSRDHSASQLAVTVGEITADQIRQHADRNVLTRALGATETVKPDITVLKNSDFDALLLCSDGFWEYVLENEMENAAQCSATAKEWLGKMNAIRLSRAPENCDNNTAIAVTI